MKKRPRLELMIQDVVSLEHCSGFRMKAGKSYSGYGGASELDEGALKPSSFAAGFSVGEVFSGCFFEDGRIQLPLPPAGVSITRVVERVVRPPPPNPPPLLPLLSSSSSCPLESDL